MYAVRGIAPSTRSGQNSHRSRVPPIRMHTPMTASANPMDPTASPTPDKWGPSRSRDRNHSPTSDRGGGPTGTRLEAGTVIVDAEE